MEVCCCDLEVDVNGEGTFMVDMKTVSSFSGRLSHLFRKSKGTRNFKVIFNDFPGGVEGFELMTRFCYNNGTIEITPSNVALLYCVAHFMEMNNSVSITCNLLEQTEKSLEEIIYWTRAELLIALEQCQYLLPFVKPLGILNLCLNSLVGKLVSTSDSSTCLSTFSTGSSGFRWSFGSRSTTSLKTLISRSSPLWYEDFVVSNSCVIEMVAKTMVSWKFDHVTISRFLFYYQKSKFVTASLHEKRTITGTVINALYSLDWSSASCKGLFGVLRAALRLNIDKGFRKKLENMIGSQLDVATLDDLLLPSPRGKKYLYHVNLVLRFLKAFLSQNVNRPAPTRLKKVASLIDLYVAEVAPDPHLKPLKLLSLVTGLPDFARESYDGIYHAMDVYLELHAGLSNEVLMKIFCALNYEKLSYEACSHLSRNTKFASKPAVQALLSQQCKLKKFTEDSDWPSKCFSDLVRSFPEIDNEDEKDQAKEQTVFNSVNLDFSSENEKFRTHLRGMQSRVVELEKVCNKMRTQMRNIIKTKSSQSSTPRALPKLL